MHMSTHLHQEYHTHNIPVHTHAYIILQHHNEIYLSFLHLFFVILPHKLGVTQLISPVAH